MPRKHRSARERAGPPVVSERRTTDAPAWAQARGVEVRIVTGDKAYRCPGCDHEIRRGIQHLVVVPMDDPSSRRHWHIECWRRELRSTRGGEAHA